MAAPPMMAMTRMVSAMAMMRWGRMMVVPTMAASAIPGHAIQRGRLVGQIGRRVSTRRVISRDWLGACRYPSDQQHRCRCEDSAHDMDSRLIVYSLRYGLLVRLTHGAGWTASGHIVVLAYNRVSGTGIARAAHPPKAMLSAAASATCGRPDKRQAVQISAFAGLVLNCSNRNRPSSA